MIDLHTHTTISDGTLTPAELVARAAADGVSVLAVTDHDTVGGCEVARAACGEAGIEFVEGIEITAVAGGSDVHVLGYFVDVQSASLAAFLVRQRQNRVERVREMLARLEGFGMPLDADEILKPGHADGARAVGRPDLARALVAKGFVASVNDAFEKWLGRGMPAFVPRVGVGPEEVFAEIHAAQGLASLAHPVLSQVDECIPAYAEAGLDALEVYHSKHDQATSSRYRALAQSLGLLVTGGSDFHGSEAHGGGAPGSVFLPREEYERLRARYTERSAASRATASGSSTSS